MPFLFRGDSTRIYTQWLDALTGRPLTAVPGGTYDMYPAGGANLTAPPGDGLWGHPPAPAWTPAPGALPDAAPGPPGLVPPLLTSATTEIEEN